ncbi:uncharacterized protein JN550_006900 [Neoarthrinium moseri]|uniref:uncharacterized protein n=1 Tax=Neoarthrinium moseri TaxID=1658444 RepID=UPI001FDE6353|nr:uncharacterized protein JN550_006900 [Neoarthrinium moseri]KAI1867759.1 hypothetical protein JN550_006900 [Neoarthrinium moseri]
MPLDFRRRYENYIEIWDPIVYALWALRLTTLKAIKRDGIAALTSFPKLLAEGFALWYRTLNTHFVRFENTTALPTLVGSAEGIVLELGPGLGNQLPRLNQDKVEHIYGIESNEFFIPELRDKVVECGLVDKYTVLAAGVEDTNVLEKSGVDYETVDTILSVQVLCSVNDPEAVAKDLYKVLKPGDYTGLWNRTWSCLIGGCNMNRDILSILRGAGEWEGFGTLDGDEEPWSVLPRTWGTLVKPIKRFS